MREISQEIGRRQLLGVMTLIERQNSPRVRVRPIGNAYVTSNRTLMPAAPPFSPHVYYDGVIGFSFKGGPPEITCLIEK